MEPELKQRHCRPLPQGTPPLSPAQAAEWLAQVPGWSLDGQRLRREYRFPDFAQALAFVNRVGAVAEQEQHHPDIVLGWGRVGIETYTHSVGGLSHNDFILAARIDAAAAA